MGAQRVQVGGLNGDLAATGLVRERDRVAPALEADGRQVDGHLTLLADDLAVLLVVSGVAAVLAGVEADAVRAAVLLDDDEAHHSAVLGLVFEAVQMAVLDLAERDRGHAVLERIRFRRRESRLLADCANWRI